MRLDTMSMIGIVSGFGVIGLAIFIGGNAGLFINVQGILITILGSMAALLVNYNLSQLKRVFATARQVFTEQPSNPAAIVDQFTELAKRARREGLLALEDEIKDDSDPFFAKSVQLMVDGLEPDLIRDIMENNINNMVLDSECLNHGPSLLRRLE